MYNRWGKHTWEFLISISVTSIFNSHDPSAYLPSAVLNPLAIFCFVDSDDYLSILVKNYKNFSFKEFWCWIKKRKYSNFSQFDLHLCIDLHLHITVSAVAEYLVCYWNRASRYHQIYVAEMGFMRAMLNRSGSKL